jgi:hypothetical protein
VPLETSITKSIVKHAKSSGWWTFKIAGGAFQRAGVPDLLCVKGGRAVFLEVKQPGKHPTELQKAVMSEIHNVGGAVAQVVTSKEEAAEVLSQWDQ